MGFIEVAAGKPGLGGKPLGDTSCLSRPRTRAYDPDPLAACVAPSPAVASISAVLAGPRAKCVADATFEAEVHQSLHLASSQAEGSNP